MRSKRRRRANQSDPTAERTGDGPIETAGALEGVRPGPGPEIAVDVLNRNHEGRYETPRQYETPEE